MESVRETIRKLYSILEIDMNANEMIGKLLTANLIGEYHKEEISGKKNKIDQNRVILDHVQSFNVDQLRSFCDVLSTCSPPSGTELARKISDTLDAELGTSMCIIIV